MPLAKRYIDPEALKKLANISLVARAIVEGFISGLHKSPFHGFSVEFAEYREYTRGDDLKHFDWKAFARSDRHYIKLYQEETNLRAYILLDASGSMAYTSGGLSKYEYGCYLAASLTYLMIRQQDSVGLAVFDERLKSYLEPHGNPRHLMNICAVLEKTKPGAETSIAGVFHSLAETIKRRGLIVIISDLLDDQQKVLNAIHHFRHNMHEVILFHLLDPAELEFPFKGLSNFRDLETGERLQVLPQVYREHYLRELESFIGRYRKECAERRVDYIVVDTSKPFDVVLMEYLARRAKMG
jgi:uncharacterized protein (DUF58 family)